MKKVMVVYPEFGKTEEELEQTRDKARHLLDNRGYEVLDIERFKDEDIKHEDILKISESLKLLSKCDTAYFCMGWHTSPGCNIIHRVSRSFGLEMVYEGLVYMNKRQPLRDKEPSIDCEFPCLVSVRKGYSLNVRNVPNNYGPITKIIGAGHKAKALRVLESDDTRWCQIVSRRGNEGYVLAHYLEVVEDE